LELGCTKDKYIPSYPYPATTVFSFILFGFSFLAPDFELDTGRVELRQSKFQSVRSLVLYVPENLSSSDTTQIDYISLYGEPVNQSLGVKGVKNEVVYLD